MRTLLCGLLLGCLCVVAGRAALAQPPKGSQMPADEVSCFMCHSEEGLWEGEKKRLYISKESLSEDVHFKNGVNCHDCHGGDPTSFDVPEAHSTVVAEGQSKVLPFRSPLTKVWDACGNCHQHQKKGVLEGVHSKAAKRDGKEGPLSCADCHGQKAHGLLPVSDLRSPVRAANQVALCGGCHEKHRSEYERSAHGRGLKEAGLVVTATCANCHGAHAVFPAEDERSTLSRKNVVATCSKCHRFVAEKLAKSVHGDQYQPPSAESSKKGKRGEAPTEATAKSQTGGPQTQTAETQSAGGEQRQRPVCTSCHQGHDLPFPWSEQFRLRVSDQCGNCHPEMLETYQLSAHGGLTELGYVPAAKCSDCHGSHDILPASDPRSRIAAGANLLQTCRRCHPQAPPKFSQFDPHANPHDPQRYPVLHLVLLAMEALIWSVMVFFVAHTLFWFTRSALHALRHGRPKRITSGEPVYVRFTPTERLFHLVLVVTFLGLALTGLPLRYSDQPWAQKLARSLGGFGSTSTWHHICGVTMILAFLVHLAWLLGRGVQKRRSGASWTDVFFGPDSPVPNLRDFADLFRMFRWFFGLGPKPVFERWTYWEKFDYWAVFWGVAIIGVSGLMLWLPHIFTIFLPGYALNVAKIIHSEEALLATSFIFAIHFFNTHLRPERFPMDMAILAGLVTEEELKEERPELWERLQQEGRLEQLRTNAPSGATVATIMALGFVALTVGIVLLVGILAAVL